MGPGQGAGEPHGHAAVLIYDGDCGFCTRLARWVERRARGRVPVVPWQGLDLEALGLTEEDVTTAAYWIDGDGRSWRGHEAVGRSLQALGRPYRWIGWLVCHPPLSLVARPAYALVANNRHRLPGSTDTCRLD